MKTYFLSDRSDPEILSRMGGKAANLSLLHEQGFPVPDGFVLFEEETDLGSAVEKIGGFPVAVRSSGTLEDMADASFAGLYETFLGIGSLDELRKAVRDCFQSKDSERVADYLRTKKIDTKKHSLKMSVLVQKMVNSQISGVLFTMNPTKGFEEECYLEYCQGLGERLVSGHVTPTRVSYNWEAEEKTFEEINQEKTKLGDHLLTQLIEASMKIQAYYGKPQDIEWAVDDREKLYILQSRPVTSYSPREDLPEVTNADLKDGGISARVCTPCMYSIYREALQVSMGEYLKRVKIIKNDEDVSWIYYFYGRGFWNAGAVKEGLKLLPDFKEDVFDRDLGIQKDYGEKGPHTTKLTLTSLMHALPVLMALYREFADAEIMVSHFREPFEARDEKFKEELPRLRRMSDEDFRKWLFDVIVFQQDTESKYFRIIYNNSNYQTEFKNFLKKVPGYEPGDEVDLMGELHGVPHLDVQPGLALLRKTADFYGFHSDTYYSERERFLKVHYHHGPAELDLFVPRWGEKKEWVDDLVRSFVASPAPTESRYGKTSLRISKSLGLLGRGKFERMLERSRAFLRMREEMRAFSTRAYYLLRIGILEFGKREGLSEKETFMLDIREIRRKVRDPSFILPDTTKRELKYDGYRNFTPPNEFGGTIMATKSSVTEGQIKGIGCSPGEFTGIARVIKDIHATHNLTKEDILVTVFTDPGWTPVLAKVGGVVTEVGGLLSHAAVIGREYGIPAILNVIQATEVISDGDKIRMNGKTGTIEILGKNES